MQSIGDWKLALPPAAATAALIKGLLAARHAVGRTYRLSASPWTADKVSVRLCEWVWLTPPPANRICRVRKGI